jgi:two-component system sensor histidine kinase UhpB
MKRSPNKVEYEAAVRHIEQRLISCLDAVSCVVVGLTPDLRITAWNQAANRIYGWSRSEALGRDYIATFLPAQAQAAMTIALRETLAGDNSQAFEIKATHRDGRNHALRVNLRRIAGGPQQAPELLLIGQPIAQSYQGESEPTDGDERLRRFSAHRDAQVEAERTRIAREIHDDLGAALTGINMQLHMALAAAADMPPTARGRLVEALELVGTAQQSLQRIIGDLRPSVLDHLGIWSGLEWLANQWQVRTGLPCGITIASALAECTLDDERATALFRIAQESLTNVARHANATRADITARIEGNAVCLTIQDDGKGIGVEHLLDLESPGLLGMHERARRLGGTLRVTGEAGRGTRVTLRLPLPV